MLLRSQRDILEKLSKGGNIKDIEDDLLCLEQNKAVSDKILEAFPGYFGRFVCLHFVRFLDEPIKNQDQEKAYLKIISFLDEVELSPMPKDLEEYMIDSTKHLGTENIKDLLSSTKALIENSEDFLKENQEMLSEYLEYKNSEEYKQSPQYRLNLYMKDFLASKGYNEIFISSMKELSSSYKEYYEKLEIANQRFIKQYPEIENLIN